MGMDRRGEIGFLEAIVATMAVCMVLTAFVGFLAAETVLESTDASDFDRSVTDGVRIEGGGYVDPTMGAALAAMAERNGYRMAEVRCHASGAEGIRPGRWTTDPDYNGNIVSDRYMRYVSSDDGRVVPTIFEVMVCT